jgi:predicted transcriptional regulator
LPLKPLEMLLHQGSSVISTVNNSVETKILKRQIAIPYFVERHVAFLPALHALRHECQLSRNEILTLLAAKQYERKNQTSFTAKAIAPNSGIGCNNLSAILNRLTETGYLRIETRGRKASWEPSRYCLTLKGVQTVGRLEDLTTQFL